MKHERPDYNRIQDPDGIIPEDEPVFLLRGQDPLAPYVLRKWADKVARHGGDPKVVNSAYAHAEVMEDWQRDRLKKGPHTPDMPLRPEDENVVVIPPTFPRPPVPTGTMVVPADKQQPILPVPDAVEEIKKKLAGLPSQVVKEPARPMNVEDLPSGKTELSQKPKTALDADKIRSDIASMRPKIS